MLKTTIELLIKPIQQQLKRLAKIHKKTPTLAITALLACLWAITSCYAQLSIKQVAPNFEATNILSGKKIALKDYKGRIVVLEWTNPDCPFVKKFYNTAQTARRSQSMQHMQQYYTHKKVVWIMINSSAKGRQGYMSAAQAQRFYQQQHIHATAVILDSKGTIGRLYGAKTTPQLFIINPEQRLAYQGAVDSHRSVQHGKHTSTQNYLINGLNQLLAKQALSTPQSRPYGCSVKYGG